MIKLLLSNSQKNSFLLSNFIHFYCKTVLAATFILIVAGGLVTSTGSGLSVPDWPLSYGQFFPPMVGGIRFEHTHRVIAAIVGLMTFAMAALLFKYEKRRWVRNLGFVAAGTILIQAILGGLTVLYLLPAWISVLHACLAQTFFCLVASIAWVTSDSWGQNGGGPNAKDAASLRRLAMITVCFVYLQLIVGAIVRHACGAGLHFHYVFAFLVVLHVLLIIRRTTVSESLRKTLLGHALLLGFLAFSQVFLGLGALVFKYLLSEPSPGTAQVLLTASHQSNGALLLAATVLFAIRSFRA